MNSEKILVVYFSRSGKTKIIAREISQKLNCAVEEIKTPTSYAGFIGYSAALIQIAFKMHPKIKPLQKNLANYDLVIFGGPIWGTSMCAPIRSFITRYKNDLKNVAFFATQSGQYGRKIIFKQMKDACGKTPLAVLDVTEKDFRGNQFKNTVTNFISKLALSNPKIEKRRIAEKARPEAVP